MFFVFYILVLMNHVTKSESFTLKILNSDSKHLGAQGKIQCYLLITLFLN